jgi:hypothetical protein
MTVFRVIYHQTESGHLYFEADNIEQAKEQLDDLRTGVIQPDDLTSMEQLSYNGEFEVEDEVEEVDE